jgi:hypothetical protein
MRSDRIKEVLRHRELERCENVTPTRAPFGRTAASRVPRRRFRRVAPV